MISDLKIKSILKYAIYKDKRFFMYIAGYAIVIALINLSLPLSIQFLINSIANTALIQPIIVIGIMLTCLLGFSAILSVMQKHLLEIYKQNSFSRISADLFLKSIYTDHEKFQQANTSDLSSHFFEILNIQYSASILVLEGFITCIQILISFVLSSAYHPYFLIMNMIALFVIWLSWVLFKHKAISRAIDRSMSKYEVFGWFNDVFRLSRYFKSTRTKEYALNKGAKLVAHHVKQRKRYWKISLTQLSILTFLYVVLAVTLFVVGSILVVKGQLSLGQLIAAEILYSVALVGASKLSYYFDLYYSLVASSDELDHVVSLSDEHVRESTLAIDQIVPEGDILQLSNVSYTNSSGVTYNFNFVIPYKSINLLVSYNDDKKNTLIALIANIIQPHKSSISIFNYHYSDFDKQALRDHIWIVDSSDIFSCSILEYLTYGYDGVTETEINSILEIVGLRSTIDHLVDKGNTVLIGNGFPLHQNQVIQLKLARVMLHKPYILLLNDVIHKISPELQIKIFDYIKKENKITVIHVSYEETKIKMHYDNVIVLDQETK